MIGTPFLLIEMGRRDGFIVLMDGWLSERR